MSTVQILIHREVEVENCPFYATSKMEMGSERGNFFIHCTDCNARGPFSESQEAAVNGWNGAARLKEQEIKIAVNTAIITERAQPVPSPFADEDTAVVKP